MTFPEFDTFQEKLLAEVVGLKDTKGIEYANSESRFANFTRLSERLNIKPTAVALVYLTKHMDAIESYISRGRTYSTESIQGRIVDAICYLTLIAGMIEEEAASAPVEDFKIEDQNIGKDQPFEYDDSPEKHLGVYIHQDQYENLMYLCRYPFKK